MQAHPGFNGSAGNPGGDQIILGGTNAFGDFIDPSAADFTLPGAGIATLHINAVARINGDDGRNTLFGGDEDDFINAGDGNDVIFGRSGWDVLSGEGGNDNIFGGSGNDIIDGGDGNDRIFAGRGDDDVEGGAGKDRIYTWSGDDNVSGGAGNDWISAGSGNDMISGGEGYDALHGGLGNDIFVFASGDGTDTIQDLDRQGDDRIALSVDGISSFEGVMDVASEVGSAVKLNFGDGDALVLLRTDLADLSSDDFLFA